MGYTSISHWIIVALVVLVLFGRGRMSETMAEFGKGISSFRLSSESSIASIHLVWCLGAIVPVISDL